MSERRYDRYGEQVAEVETDASDRHDCRRGWLRDDPVTGLPVPCPICKPHLSQRRIGGVLVTVADTPRRTR